MSGLIANRWITACLWLASLSTLSACSISYPLQAARGHLELVNNREPVADLLAGDRLDDAVRLRLQASRDILTFAHRELLLPDNGSYRYYSDTGRPYVVWNVFAAPELSLRPKRWCFPVVGCVSYRGYFAESDARTFAGRLEADRYDVYVGGVRAYSTLGNFKDPLLNTMINMSDVDFIGLIFHELAHQKLYVKDDSAFNESFATAVEQAGLHRWFTLQEQELPDRARYNQRRQQVVELLRQTRRSLKRLYASDLTTEKKRQRKQEIFSQLPERYAQLDKQWASEVPPGSRYRRPYAGFIAQGLNNASLAAVATYNDYVPAFDRLLRAVCADQFDCFYAVTADLAAMPRDKREARLEQLLDDARRMQGLRLAMP